MQTLRDVRAALRSVGARDTRALAVSALPPPQGIGELVDALDEHRARLDLAQRRLRARRANALADFMAEHGDRALRALGGRRSAQRWLAEQDPALDVPALTARLESRALEEA
jgi:LAO/AO transport system kinase